MSKNVPIVNLFKLKGHRMRFLKSVLLASSCLLSSVSATDMAAASDDDESAPNLRGAYMATSNQQKNHRSETNSTAASNGSLCDSAASTLSNVLTDFSDAVPDAVLISSKERNYRTRFLKSKKIFAVRQGRDGNPEAVDALLQSVSTVTSSNGALGGFRLVQYIGATNAQSPLAVLKFLAPQRSIVTHVFHSSEGDETPFVPTGRIHLKFREDADANVCTQLLKTYGLAVEKTLGKTEFFVRVRSSDHQSMAISAKLQEHDDVLIAVPECVTPAAKRAFPPTNALIKDQWHLENTGNHRGTQIGLRQGADAQVIGAWNLMGNLGSSDIRIAIIDDGFDIEHPALGGVDSTKIVAPWDFTRNTNNPLPEEGDWHGTAVAGVATGIDDGGDIIGAAPRARLMPIRWDKDLSDESIENWFYWAMENKADIINCSWGAQAKYYQLTPYQQAVLEKVGSDGRDGKGCVIVFAAGNESRDINNPGDGTRNGFAIHPNVIAVAASTSLDEKADYSNFGREISISAPSGGAGGLGILTSDVRGNGRGYNKKGDYDEGFSGTSSAAPLVSGIAALVLSVNPKLTSEQVKKLLEETARKIERDGGTYDDSGRSINFGFGCVNAKEAILKLIPPIASSYEKAYLQFLRGKLIWLKNDDRIELPIAALNTPWDESFNLSQFGDIEKRLNISTGYRTGKKPVNENKVEIWIVPRFLVEKDQNEAASHLKPILSTWSEDNTFGIFWTWGNWDDLSCFEYDTNPCQGVDLYTAYTKASPNVQAGSSADVVAGGKRLSIPPRTPDVFYDAHGAEFTFSIE